MNTKLLKIRKFERYLFAGILAVIMFLAAQFTGHKEIIFPEILAILIGTWISKKQPWNVDKFRIFLLTTLAAAFGVILVRYFPCVVYYKIIIGFLFTGMLLVLGRTNFIPAIPAGIFPVFMNVKTLVYPVSVAILTAAIVIGEWVLEKYHFKYKRPYKQENNVYSQFQHWIKLFFLFALVSIIPLNAGYLFWLSPPAVVTFAEVANPMSMNRKNKKGLFKVWGIMTIAALIGTIFRVLINLQLGLPLAIAAVFAITTLFLIYNKTNFLYPPSGGALLMPMILKPAEVVWYPLEVALGLAVLIPIAVAFFPKTKPVM